VNLRKDHSHNIQIIFVNISVGDGVGERLRAPPCQIPRAARWVRRERDRLFAVSVFSFPLPSFATRQWVNCLSSMAFAFTLQFSAMDVSVRSTMKGAAKCDKHCELQDSVNRQGLERILCFWDIPESTPASVSVLYNSSTGSHFGWRGAASTRVSRKRASTSFVWALSRHRKHKTVRCRNQLTDRFGV
jgi:hypothetical protein